MTNYRTPGVFINEVSTLPPSVAEGSTAIPAFLGYTQLKPEGGYRKISSMLEYERAFGGPAPISITTIEYTSGKVGAVKLNQSFYLYDSIRLYFQNGGGPCYIFSTGDYTITSKDPKHFEVALDALSLLDEPTLILFPDAVSFTQGQLSIIQTKALSQCAELGDRFAILDILRDDFDQLDGEIGKGFRNGIAQNLKYGAAYTPWLLANTVKDISYKDVKGKINNATDKSILDFFDLTRLSPDVITSSSKAVKDLDNEIKDLDLVVKQKGKFLKAKSSIEGGTGDYESIEAGFGDLKRKILNLVASKPLADARNELPKLFKFLYSFTDILLDDAVYGETTQSGKLIHDTLSLISKSEEELSQLMSLDKIINSKDNILYDLTTPQANIFDAYSSKFKFTTNPNENLILTFKETDKDDDRLQNITLIVSFLSDRFSNLLNAVNSLQNSIETNIKNLDLQLQSLLPAYRNLLQDVSKTLSILPPSGAIAGIYCQTDLNEGVWKAPANIAIAGVTGVTRIIDDKTQMKLNVDPDAGKSINAIRTFTGRGTVVWGARTLDGLSSEWKYISVRRFFNAVEEDLKKATAWAVFAPNNNSTWIKIKAGIENYLNNKWKQGALAGTKAEDAYRVRIGLGQTMTAQDILDGQMVIEIGLAVSRPAEFIVIQFSHLLQK